MKRADALEWEKEGSRIPFGRRNPSPDLSPHEALASRNPAGSTTVEPGLEPGQLPPLAVLHPRLTLTPKSAVASSPPPDTRQPPPAAAQLRYGATSGCYPLRCSKQTVPPPPPLDSAAGREFPSWSSHSERLLGDLSCRAGLRPRSDPASALRLSSRKCAGEVGGPVKRRHRRAGSGAEKKSGCRWWRS